MMRRVSAWVTGVLVGAIGLALASAAATGATGANLNGRFSVAETTTYVNGIVRDYVGRAYTYSWTLVPACQVGSCATGLTSSSGLRFQLTPAGAGFVGSTTLSARREWNGRGREPSPRRRARTHGTGMVTDFG